jgi:LysM repeat protein
VVIDRQQVARFAAPAAFLLAVTILVLLVRSATSEDEPATSPPPATTQAPATTAAPAATTPPPETAPATTAAGSTYTIEAGDTLQTIADQYGTTVEELLVLNPDVDPTALQIGQTIRVP